jgi:hypothetical protein
MEKFRVFQIDAWADPEGGWTYNDRYECFDFESTFNDVEENFEKALNYNGVVYDEDKFEIRVEEEGFGDRFELICVEDDCPMYEAVAMYNA